MRAIRVHQHGGVDQLRLDDVPAPEPARGEILVRIKAVGMNHMDLWVRKGLPGVRLPLPLIPGCEASGVVEECGQGISSFKNGDEVVIDPIIRCGACAKCREGNTHLCSRFGLYGETENGFDAEQVVVPERNLLKKPKGIGFEEAAAVPVTFITAWHMLVDKCGITSGQIVLIVAASSGVGSAGVQIARHFGARVIATAGSDERAARAKELGADWVINHSKQEIDREVKRITEGRGVDIVFEHVGAATWERSMRCLGLGGKIVTCGATTGPEVKINLVHLFIKHQQIIGSTMGPSSALPKIFDLIAQKKLKPVIDHVFPFDQVQEAHQRLEGRGQFGKIVLVP